MQYRMYVDIGGNEPKEYLISEEEREAIVTKPREDSYIFNLRSLNISLPRRSIMLIEPHDDRSPVQVPATPSRRGKRLHETVAEE
jgi:hypothetical protein